ncbi:unnamed protein product [Paramecium primaurelia]|uniref:Uncharacterized protein n=1 Tax=Paramecium primaurelia TaxID=5886 RepID=A0A8S1M9J6_PARPR|nr:unnamed protein product [Paramecium primaurelia]
MNQLKFVRSKSTTRSSPLKRIHSKLRQVQKPGKLNVSVGKSRQSSENKEAIHISTPKEKVQKLLQQLSIYQRNSKKSYLETPERTQSFIPLSHERNLFNESIKLQDSNYRIYKNNMYQKNKQNDQVINLQPKIEESTITEKLDAFQLKQYKRNSSDQTTQDQQSPSNTIYANATISQFYYNKEILKQSYSINQLQSADKKQLYQQKHQQIIQKNTPQSQSHSRNNSIKNQSKENIISQEQIIKNKNNSKNDYDEIILEIYPQFLKQCQQNAITKKTIVEQTEEEEHFPTKLSTKSPQQVQLYSELQTDKSLVLISPKVVKDMEMQTSFTQPIKISQDSIEKPIISNQFDTVNASVQTKLKKKNLGLFQYQFSYMSPQNNNNHQDIDLLSLGDFQSEILHRTQSEFERDYNIQSKQKYKQEMQKIQDFYVNPQIIQTKQQTNQQNDSRSFLLSQKSNLFFSKEQLLDPQDDNHPYYLQAEPKEINSNFYLKQVNQDNLSQDHSKQKRTNISNYKLEKGSSFSSTQCYKDHLNILLSQSQQANTKETQHQPYLNQKNSIKKKQNYPLRTTSFSNQKTKKKQNTLKNKK